MEYIAIIIVLYNIFRIERTATSNYYVPSATQISSTAGYSHLGEYCLCVFVCYVLVIAMSGDTVT